MIAIVDDDRGAREGLETLLRSLGYKATTFVSAEDFLSSEKLHSTSCVITDLHMPGLSGLDMHDRLIAEGHRIPVIVITARPDDRAQLRAMQNGAICFLRKPFEHDEFVACLETALKAA
jgi:FixJ family two-component response regulator